MSPNFPTYQTNTLLLRQFTENDLDEVFRGLSHPDIIPYYGVSYQTREAAKEQMRWYADLEKNNTGIWWAVCSADNGIFYGAGGLNGINHEHKKAEIGFWLFPEYWGKGIMAEAMTRICLYGFEQLGLHRIEGLVESENTKCKKAISKLDFHYEGTMRDCERKNGKYISLDMYAKLNR